ncbi:hypothetical protein [Streptomyces sp. AC512_CC834]|uniref:hypothetical protein n=1 Tax=Streptomyces sp. AC512_CC834 TaxID=2823691 RepID=UPI001C27821B|nr:hypothetical protein [Streptomyces sp. AC512_CC834]
MDTGVPLASVKSQIFEAVLGFLPVWVQISVLALIVLAVLASWVVKLRRRIAGRRATRAGQAVRTTAQDGQGTGADHLGPYAPPRQEETGADFLGSYAPSRQRGNGSA